MKILFLTASIGTGHNKAIESVTNALKILNQGDIEYKIVDIYNYINTALGKFVSKSYERIVNLVPNIYGYFYAIGEDSTALKDFLHHVGITKVKKLIEEYDPDIIVSSHESPTGMVANLKQEYNLKKELVGIITDFRAHPFWVYKEIDRYMVPNILTKEYLIKQGIPEERIYITGIPVDLKFTESYDKLELQKRFNLEPGRFTILLMGSWLDIGIDTLFESLNKLNLPVQIIAVSGKNRSLQERLEKLKEKANIPVTVFGFISNVYEVMHASDIIITKPGGLISSETLAAGLPMIIVNPIPGQEEYNTIYLTTEGAAVRVNKLSEVPIIIDILLKSKERILEMAKNARRIGKPKASYEIAKLLLCRKD
jgi:processive 1,2-diacylglycerol beta-glucosyltransferase